ncbi:MAG: 16S rRNA (cytosine(1402)-N(4))-methyltransferase RsmH [Saprospiraceae bacterium]|nr:16S rRNA (cytosine(1402)-N(4))-methyltransferase RsmH [Saprospiraceae bacterium]
MGKQNSEYHIPVLLNSSVEALITNINGTYVDCTFGGGSHSRKILSKLGKKGRLIAFDKDKDSLRNSIDNDDRFQLIHSDFRYLKKYLLYYNIDKIDGVLADLGVSSHQLDENERGFSFQSDRSLDMRMNRNQELSAEMLLKNYSEMELSRVWKTYSELTNASKIAHQWIKERKSVRIKTCKDFAEWVSPFVYGPRNKFLAKLFQGIRIEVNQELSGLEELLQQCSELLQPGGRMVILSYHSLEDRLVKKIIKGESNEPLSFLNSNESKMFRLVNRKLIEADDEEMENNSRSRSVKMRIAEKI